MNLNALTCDWADYLTAPLVDGTSHCARLLAAPLAETVGQAAALPA